MLDNTGMHGRKEKIHGMVKTSCVTPQENLTVENYSHGILQDHLELKKHLISRG